MYQKLSKWNKIVFGNVTYNIKRVQQKLERLMSIVDFDVNEINSCKKELNELLHKEYEFGIWQHDPRQIEHVVVKYFEEIFTPSNPSKMDDVYKGLDQRIPIEKMNQLDKE